MELVISSGPPLSDLAFEKDILGSAGAEAVLFMYEWDRPFLVMGYSQDFTGIRTGYLRSSGIAVLRRMTGGTAVLGRKALSLSLVIPMRKGRRGEVSINECYDLFTGSVQDGLRECGIDSERCSAREKSDSPVCFFGRGPETLMIGGRKFFGGAQRRVSDLVLVHGVLLLDHAPDLHPLAFEVTPEEVQRKISSIRTNDIEGLKRKLCLAFADRLGDKITGIFKAEPTLASIKEQKNEKWSPLSTS